MNTTSKKEYTHIFRAECNGDYQNLTVNLLLVHFQEDNVHFVYSPHLDLAGYGYGLEQAENSLQIAFQDFIQYTLENNTLEKVLSELGWETKEMKKSSFSLTLP